MNQDVERLNLEHERMNQDVKRLNLENEEIKHENKELKNEILEYLIKSASRPKNDTQ